MPGSSNPSPVTPPRGKRCRARPAHDGVAAPGGLVARARRGDLAGDWPGRTRRPRDVRGGKLVSARPGAVVIGGDYQGLGIVRRLGRRGVDVVVLDDERSISRHSRYATDSYHFAELRTDVQTVAA